MKKIYLILYCFSVMLSSHSYGENNPAVGLKIGGISLFDNLYDHLTPKQVREKSQGFENYYEHLKDPYKFSTLIVENHPTINKKYEYVEIRFKDDGERLIIHGISAGDFYTNIDFCYEDMKKQVLYISDNFPYLKKYDPNISSHPADSSGKSTINQTIFTSEKFEIEVACYDWSEELTRLKGWTDNLTLGIDSIMFSNWVGNY